MKCVTILAKDAVTAHKDIGRAQDEGADLVEFRIDGLEDIHNLEAIIIGSPLPILATARKMDQKILLRAIDAGAKYIDMDVEEFDPEVAAYAKTRHEDVKVVISSHDYKKTDSKEKLEELVLELEGHNPDMVKVITTATRLEDNETVLGLLCSKPIITICMGELGKISRIVCGACAPWTYFCLDEPKAPGQIPLRKEMYLLIGNPLSQSLSPLIQQAMLDLNGMDGVYSKVECTGALLEHFFEGAKALGVRGINVTIPFKEAVIPFVHELDPLAREMGAVNTILNDEGTLRGYNTDGVGVVNSLKEITPLKGKKVLILGAGGGARGAAHALTSAQAEVTICNRTFEKAQELAKNCGGKTLEWEKRNFHAKTYEIILNATSIGMGTTESPLSKDAIGNGQIAFDLVYKPRITEFLKNAQKRGASIISGENALVYQGAIGFEIWTGKKADIEIMRNAVRSYFGEKHPQNNVILIGMMGSGKSSVGKEMVKRLKREFIDVDEVIKQMAGKEITEIFKNDGETEFRRLERRAVELICLKENCIIAMGGGAVINPGNVKTMKGSGKIVWLEVEPKTAAQRIKRETTRPLLEGNEKREETLSKLLEKRRKAYEKAADIKIRTDGKEIAELAREIMVKLDE